MKQRRQSKIVDIITSHIVSTQDELAQILKTKGFPVTQATISRDIKELGLLKVSAGDGRYRYALPLDSISTSPVSRLKRVFKDSVIGIDYSENIIVIKTLDGNAHAVAACLDHLERKEILGTLAGDDTILVVIKPKSAIEAVYHSLNKLLE